MFFFAKKLWIIVLFTQKFVIKLSKIWVWDPGSGKNLCQIPDPQHWALIWVLGDQFLVINEMLYQYYMSGETAFSVRYMQIFLTTYENQQRPIKNFIK